jgi:hypothetical protein
VPGMRSAGTSRRVGQVAAPGRVNLALVPTGTTGGRIGELWQHSGSQRDGAPDRSPEPE